MIAEFRVSRDPNRVAPQRAALLTSASRSANHNGGMIAFGPDGFLYIALGDGGRGGDPGNRAQNPDELLGKILRIDVDGRRPYAHPARQSVRRRRRAAGDLCAWPAQPLALLLRPQAEDLLRRRRRAEAERGDRHRPARPQLRLAGARGQPLLSSRPRTASAAASSCRAPNTATAAAAAR